MTLTPAFPGHTEVMIAVARKQPLSSTRHCELVMLALKVSEDGVCVSDERGQRLFSSDALHRIVAEESERETLEGGIDDARQVLLTRVGLGVSTDGASELTLQVRTSEMEYRLQATAITDPARSASERLYVIWVRRCKPRLLTEAILRDRFGLTPREVRVSTLLAARLHSREIAKVLGISVHTARRHAEAVLRKLGVSSRNELRDRLRVDAASG